MTIAFEIDFDKHSFDLLYLFVILLTPLKSFVAVIINFNLIALFKFIMIKQLSANGGNVDSF